MAFVNQSKRDGQPLSPRCSGGRRRWHPFFKSVLACGVSRCSVGANSVGDLVHGVCSSLARHCPRLFDDLLSDYACAAGWLHESVGAHPDRVGGDGLAPVERDQLHAAASVAPASPELCPRGGRRGCWVDRLPAAWAGHERFHRVV